MGIDFFQVDILQVQSYGHALEIGKEAVNLHEYYFLPFVTTSI